MRLVVGVDRLDYTKGLTEKVLAVERLLETQPALSEQFAFVQIAEPSRSSLAAYRAARTRLAETAARVNARFGSSTRRVVHLLEAHHESADVHRFYRAADVCFVNSLHDGMNLVAKEFARARDDERGVLVLSRYAGAVRQLTEALIVDPHDTDQCAAALAQALTMPADEQAWRLRRMRATVKTFDASWWAGRLIEDAMRERLDGTAAWNGRPTIPISA